MTKRLYIGVTLAVKDMQYSKEAAVKASATAHLVTAKSQKQAEREASDAARREFGSFVGQAAPGVERLPERSSATGIHKQLFGMRTKMILQVHDELVFDVHANELEQIRQIVKDGMENVAKLTVPLVADIGVGQNWLECK